MRTERSFGSKAMVAERVSNRKNLISGCGTADLVEQKKPLEEITAADLDFWLKEDHTPRGRAVHEAT